MVGFFLSDIDLPIFVLFNTAISRIGNTKKILFPSSKEQDDTHPLCPLPPTPPPPPNMPFIADFQNYTRLI